MRQWHLDWETLGFRLIGLDGLLPASPAIVSNRDTVSLYWPPTAVDEYAVVTTSKPEAVAQAWVYARVYG